jgi:hypothetical protein
MQGQAVRRPKVVLLGASNLTRALNTVVRLAQSSLLEPADFLVACGHGRSYGMDSTVLVRTLPGIAPCGLWSTLSQLPSSPTRALVTDVGNDLLYGARPERIAAWVESCLVRIAADDARIVLTGLPLASLAALSRWRFALLSRMLFPLHPARFDQVRDDAIELDARLRQLAALYSASWIEPPGEWYGFDPIHIRMSVWDAAWKKILENWFDAPAAAHEATSARFAQWWRLKRMRPAQRRMFGIERHAAQPAGRLGGGSRVFFF